MQLSCFYYQLTEINRLSCTTASNVKKNSGGVTCPSLFLSSGSEVSRFN